MNCHQITSHNIPLISDIPRHVISILNLYSFIIFAPEMSSGYSAFASEGDINKLTLALKEKLGTVFLFLYKGVLVDIVHVLIDGLHDVKVLMSALPSNSWQREGYYLYFYHCNLAKTYSGMTFPPLLLVCYKPKRIYMIN